MLKMKEKKGKELIYLKRGVLLEYYRQNWRISFFSLRNNKYGKIIKVRFLESDANNDLRNSKHFIIVIS